MLLKNVSLHSYPQTTKDHTSVRGISQIMSGTEEEGGGRCLYQLTKGEGGQSKWLRLLTNADSTEQNALKVFCLTNSSYNVSSLGQILD